MFILEQLHVLSSTNITHGNTLNVLDYQCTPYLDYSCACFFRPLFIDFGWNCLLETPDRAIASVIVNCNVFFSVCFCL